MCNDPSLCIVCSVLAYRHGSFTHLAGSGRLDYCILSRATARILLTSIIGAPPKGNHGLEGTRYFKMKAETPIEFSHATTGVPSKSQLNHLYAPPGFTTTAVVAFGTKYGVNVGIVTLPMLP